jgi:hypothetical protein
MRGLSNGCPPSQPLTEDLSILLRGSQSSGGCLKASPCRRRTAARAARSNVDAQGHAKVHRRPRRGRGVYSVAFLRAAVSGPIFRTIGATGGSRRPLDGSRVPTCVPCPPPIDAQRNRRRFKGSPQPSRPATRREFARGRGLPADHPLSRSGGIGRRAGLKIQCPQGRGGSSPPSGTSFVPAICS